MKVSSIVGVLLAVLGLFFSSTSYAQKKKIQIKLPESITFYSPETGEEDVVYADEILADIEESQAEEDEWFADDDEDEDELFADNPNSNPYLDTFSKKKDATQVTDKRVVFLDITTNKGKKDFCSGAVVGDYAVLTAAHCLHEAKNITVYAGGKGSKLYAYKDRVYYSKLHTRYAPLDSEADWGIVVLKTALGKKTGKFKGSAPVLYTTEKISIMGFPGSLKKDRPWLSKGKVLPKQLQPGGLVATAVGSFNHSAWIEGGMSGGPIFQGWTKSSYIIGVNAGNYVHLVSVGSGLGMIPSIIKQARKYTPSK
ncbi:MAG: trypsin-like peptidase domain-containing protein [Elusimicrobiaceae bacterium]|nr:trypsin-like peptidase domain-containing protein [Elusimicrobiaceae bacterium]